MSVPRSSPLFQFYLSSIKRHVPTLGRLGKSSFNSTLVQLKDDYDYINRQSFDKFQFYLSSIKSIMYDDWQMPVYCFNSTLVQLKEEMTAMFFDEKTCFNSTLVQLKVWTG